MTALYSLLQPSNPPTTTTTTIDDNDDNDDNDNDHNDNDNDDIHDNVLISVKRRLLQIVRTTYIIIASKTNIFFRVFLQPCVKPQKVVVLSYISHPREAVAPVAKFKVTKARIGLKSSPPNDGKMPRKRFK